MILELLNDPAFLRFIGDKGVRTLDDARQYILNGPIESYRRFGFGDFSADTFVRQFGATIQFSPDEIMVRRASKPVARCAALDLCGLPW